jgi:hypothetical protein
MFSHVKWALIVPMAWTTLSATQSQTPGQDKDARRPQLQPAEVRLNDGSLVRMTILQDMVDIQTKYGKLSIPMKDVRRIEFGLHLPEGVEPRIEQALRQIGSETYKEREEGMKQLITLGHFAYPSLQRAAQSKDLEVVKRASLVMKKIDDRLAPEQLRLKVEDTIQTAEFTISGRIVSPSIKVHSDTFGEFDLKLSQLRSMHQRGQVGDVELLVDAAMHGSSVDQWMDTGLTVDSNLRLVVRSEGQVDLWPQGPGQYMTGPKGYNTAGKGGAYMAGTLLGKVGETGKAFIIGEQFEGVPSGEGKLFVHIVPSPWNNASTGNYRVRVRTDYVSLSSPITRLPAEAPR